MGNNSTNNSNNSSDLKDSARDLAEMKSEPVTIDLPDVKDIPGQENIVPAIFGVNWQINYSAVKKVMIFLGKILKKKPKQIRMPMYQHPKKRTLKKQLMICLQKMI